MCKCSVVSAYLVAVGLGEVGSWKGDAAAEKNYSYQGNVVIYFDDWTLPFEILEECIQRKTRPLGANRREEVALRIPVVKPARNDIVQRLDGTSSTEKLVRNVPDRNGLSFIFDSDGQSP